ncbi:siderophore-interacting protein [Vibrio renipiscarius]|uniref:Siderophore-interacting protein ViuB n=1 Tax=Vibrio renipiscarius TaxID=1461322 RepID=A0A0C2K3M2_9VIBR|nr:siderophore-interacting protein [Vibrio renipiscarius]KII76558.1 siderophore-interacting protein ViuB [Vibrio renipiscarius]KII77921.1 siderophore-interacting protein ViuB [Vibrio renipiscarius]
MHQAPKSQSVTVRSSETITPNMQRIILQGDVLANFPADCEGGYIKLLFNAEGGTDLSTVAEGVRPMMRTYTIRRFMMDENAIEVDFVRHITEDNLCGFASRWAMEAQIGDSIEIRGPGTISSLNHDADWFLLAADMTALPALSAKIKLLPENAKGYAVIEVEHEDDIQPLDIPAGIEVKWVTSDLALAVRSVAWLEGQVSAWVACEFDAMRALRQYLRNDQEIERDFIYISSYWKRGVSEDGHKVIKQQDAQENDA